MRLHRAALLVSSVSILSALNVLSAPLGYKVKPKDADDLLLSVRIGLAGAKVNFREAHGAHVGTNADTDADVLDPDFVRIALPNKGPDHNPEPDVNANSDKITFPELPSFVKEAMDEARDAARKAATYVTEKEHEIEEEIKSMFETDNKDAGVPVVNCVDQTSWRSKANKVENWFRKLVGLTLVQRSECTESTQLPMQPHSQSLGLDDGPKLYHVVTEENSVPVPGPAADTLKAEIAGNAVPCHKNTESAAAQPVISVMLQPAPPTRLRPGRLWGWRRPQTFYGRLQKALYSLSPWEGRALAFVLGCGIGVLLRMIYVFIVLGVRLWQCKRLQAIKLAEDEAQVTIFDVNELEDEELPPPMYNENEDQVQYEKLSIDGH